MSGRGLWIFLTLRLAGRISFTRRQPGCPSKSGGTSEVKLRPGQYIPSSSEEPAFSISHSRPSGSSRWRVSASSPANFAESTASAGSSSPEALGMSCLESCLAESSLRGPGCAASPCCACQLSKANTCHAEGSLGLSRRGTLEAPPCEGTMPLCKRSLCNRNPGRALFPWHSSSSAVGLPRLVGFPEQ